ncbi:MAG TPA: DUF1926 domain-containing protein [bacterium]|nr:DUF1926 domain-containing protein [bacterium]HPN44217.1 DUF1926 domain-containing protein [bacterium]
MVKINLVLGTHNHQPIGNFDFVFEQAFQQSYLPFLNVLQQHPRIRIAQHYSGILFEWLTKNHPELIKQLQKLVRSGQVEMMTGGYYEPILTSIPERDIIGQIKKLSQYVMKKTGVEPTGLWLTERVWEPYLAGPIAKAGVKYTVMDDSHFKSAGLQDQNLFGYYITEHEGEILKIFPISERMRYLIPFQPPEKTIEFLRSLATEEGDRLVVFADDGEKFGVWPGTFVQCYERKWLDRLFTLIEENLDWINLLTFSEATRQLKPAGTIYLPTASYREMMEWAMPVNAIKDYEHFFQWCKDNHVSDANLNFIKGGFWRNFLAKYTEANNLQKRMQLGSNRLNRLAGSNHDLETARDLVYAGQCNCPYWHGVFGGLYLPHLRYAIYSNLIQADVEMDKIEFREQQKTGWVNSEITDFNADGYDEVVVQTDRMNLFFSPKNGGCLTELDFKPKSINLVDTMTRRPEAYHQKLFELDKPSHPASSDDSVASIHDIVLTKEPGLDKYLNYDWYPRASMLDHFLRPDSTLESVSQAKYGEQSDFVNQPFEVSIAKKANDHELVLERNGHVWVEGEFVPVNIKKKVQVKARSDYYMVKYIVTNNHTRAISVWFGVEFATSLLAGNAPDRNYIVPGQTLQDSKLASIGAVDNIKKIQLRDDWLGLQISFETSREAAFWRYPIETISMSEAGFERVYQCSIVMPNWKITLEPGEQWNVTIKQGIEQL